MNDSPGMQGLRHFPKQVTCKIQQSQRVKGGDLGQRFLDFRSSGFNTQHCSVLGGPGNVVKGRNFKFRLAINFAAAVEHEKKFINPFSNGLECHL